jgi:hypothetical protein
MYHGGRKWVEDPYIRKSNKGNYEGGNGIYFTNSYLTARSYAKGGGVVHKAKIKRDFKDIKNVNVSIEKMIDFIKSLYRMKHKKEIISDIRNYSDRVNKKDIPLEILNNLIINFEAGSGNIGPQVAEFFVSNGADASMDHHSGDEYWFVVFNPKIILGKPSICPPNIPLDEYMLKI